MMEHKMEFSFAKSFALVALRELRREQVGNDASGGDPLGGPNVHTKSVLSVGADSPRLADCDDAFGDQKIKSSGGDKAA